MSSSVRRLMESPPRWRSGSPPRQRPTAFRGSPSPPRRDDRGNLVEPVIAPLDRPAIEVLRYLTRHWVNDNKAPRFDSKSHAITMAKTLHRSALVIAGEDECERHDPFFLPSVFAKLLLQDEPEGDVLKFQNFCSLVLIALPRMTKSGMCTAPSNAVSVLKAATRDEVVYAARSHSRTRGDSARRAAVQLQKTSRIETLTEIYRTLAGDQPDALLTFQLLRVIHDHKTLSAYFWDRAASSERLDERRVVGWLNDELPQDQQQFERSAARLLKTARDGKGTERAASRGSAVVQHRLETAERNQEAAAKEAALVEFAKQLQPYRTPVESQENAEKEVSAWESFNADGEAAALASLNAEREAAALASLNAQTEAAALASLNAETEAAALASLNAEMEAAALASLNAQTEAAALASLNAETEAAALASLNAEMESAALAPLNAQTDQSLNGPGLRPSEFVGRSQSLQQTEAEQKRAQYRDEQKRAREQDLCEVFDVFDVDSAGIIDAHELLQLAKGRRRKSLAGLGQQPGEWTDEMNSMLVGKMVAEGDGTVNCQAFIEPFEQALPQGATDFKRCVREFMAAGHAHQQRANYEAEKQQKVDQASARRQQQDEDTARQRRQMLSEVFDVFEMDGAGVIEATQLLQLGQQSGEWTDEMNSMLVEKMVAEGDGTVNCQAFIEHFEQALPQGQEQFNSLVLHFIEVAQKCRQQLIEATAEQETAVAREAARKAAQEKAGSDNTQAERDAAIMQRVQTEQRNRAIERRAAVGKEQQLVIEEADDALLERDSELQEATDAFLLDPTQSTQDEQVAVEVADSEEAAAAAEKAAIDRKLKLVEEEQRELSAEQQRQEIAARRAQILEASDGWRNSEEFGRRLKQANELRRSYASTTIQRWWWWLWEDNFGNALHAELTSQDHAENEFLQGVDLELVRHHDPEVANGKEAPVTPRTLAVESDDTADALAAFLREI